MYSATAVILVMKAQKRSPMTTNCFVIPPKSNSFSIGWQHATSRGPKLSNSPARANKSHKLPREPTTWTFDLDLTRSCNQETVPNLCASWLQANTLYAVGSLFSEKRGILKHFMTGPPGNWFLFSPDHQCSQWGSWSNKTNLFHLEPIIKCLLFTSDQSICWSGNFMLSKILNTTLNTSLHQCCWNVCP